MISDDLIELLASGVDLYVATSSGDALPESVLGMGMRVHADRRTVTVYVPNVLAALTLQNLAQRRDIAVTLRSPTDHRSVELHGHCFAARPTSNRERAHREVFRSAAVTAFASSVPRALTRGLPWWPSTAVDIELSD